MVRVVYPELKYRVQLPPHAGWSEWRSWKTPIKEPHILSIQVSENITETHPEYEHYKKIMQQIEWPK